MNDSCWQVTAAGGFLVIPEPIDDAVPFVVEPLRPMVRQVLNTAQQLPQLLASGNCREACHALPSADFSTPAAISDPRAAERLHQAYAFLSNAYLWQPNSQPTQVLPKALASPFVQLSTLVQRPPTLSYTDTQLVNWRRIDPDGPLTVENLQTIQVFQSLPDEAWFWRLHIAIEACGGPAVVAGSGAVRSAQKGDRRQLEGDLETVLDGLQSIIANARRMTEGCRPEVYFQTLRPFLFAYPDGVVFEGVDDFDGELQIFLGQTGAQSSLIPAIAAVLGIRHQRTELTTYLEDVRAYMPGPHRRFVAGLEGTIVRDLIQGCRGTGSLRDLYNSCVEQLIVFRRLHLGLAASYIASQMDDPMGTGGTDFMRFLDQMTRETAEQFL